jgi:murein DD-endopeptidase MepM/ murein hydrolase activator NlpD
MGVILALFLLLPLPAALAVDDGLEPGFEQEPTGEPLPISEATVVYEMYFPIQGGATYGNNFGDPRSGGRSHAGIDIMLPKMTPVLAVASGYVGWMHDGTDPDRPCCAFDLNHDDGWESWYIHLNNDTPGTDDGLGWGFAPGIERGARVEAGQLVGWVGREHRPPSSLRVASARPCCHQPVRFAQRGNSAQCPAGLGQSPGLRLQRRWLRRSRHRHSR